MYCNHCGNYCDGTMKFCNKCGAQLQLNEITQISNKPMDSFSYQHPYQNTQVPKMTFIDKLKKTRVLALIAAIMAIISQSASIIFFIVFVNMDDVNMNDPDVLVLPISIFFSFLIINVPSFIYFIKSTLSISNLLNNIEINYNRNTVEQVILKISKPKAIIIMIINIFLIPLSIMQVIASFSILNLKKFYDMNRNSIY